MWRYEEDTRLLFASGCGVVSRQRQTRSARCRDTTPSRRDIRAESDFTRHTMRHTLTPLILISSDTNLHPKRRVATDPFWTLGDSDSLSLNFSPM